MFKKFMMDCWIFMMFQRFPLYNDTYFGDTNQAGLNGLTKLPVTSLAVGLNYWVAEKVGTDAGGDERFVMRARTILATGDVVELMRRAVNEIRAGVAYTTNGGFSAEAPEGFGAEGPGENDKVFVAKEDMENENAQRVQGHFLSAEDLKNNPLLKEKGYTVGSYIAIPIEANDGGASKEDSVDRSVDRTSLTIPKTTNPQGVQNDGPIASNTTNQIQAEQISHTIFQTTVPQDNPKPPPLEAKTTTPAGVQNDDLSNKGTERNSFDNVPQGGELGRGAEIRQDEINKSE